MRVLLLAGSPREVSVTRKLLEVARDYGYRAHEHVEFDLVHLGTDRVDAFRGYDEDYSEATRRVVERITRADALIVGSPVYNGAYTAALKNVFEFVDYKSLAGGVAGVVVVGGGERGFLQVRAQLGQLLTYFNLHVIPRPVFATKRDVTDAVPEDIVERLEGLVDDVVAVSERLSLDVRALERARADEGETADAR